MKEELDPILSSDEVQQPTQHECFVCDQETQRWDADLACYICERCDTNRREALPECDVCSQEAKLYEVSDDDDAVGYHGTLWVCSDCIDRKNASRR